VQLGGEHVDLASRLRVCLELKLLFVEVVVRLGLLEVCLPVLAEAGGSQPGRPPSDLPPGR
jgi:hypothetical protein